MYIYNHHSTGSFLPVSSNQSSKDSDPPSADQDQPCFCMLFCSVDHSVYNLSTGSGQYSYIPCCACVLLPISKRNEPAASCISLCVMLTACCLGSLSYVIYHTFGVIFHPHGQSTEFYPESMIAHGWLRIFTMPLSGGLRVFSHAVLLFSFLLIFHTIIMIFIPIMIYMFTFP